MIFEFGVGDCCGHNMFYGFAEDRTKQRIKEGMWTAVAEFLGVKEKTPDHLGKGGFTSVVLNEHQTAIKAVLEKDFGFKEVYKSFNHRSGNYIYLLVIDTEVLINLLYPEEE